MAHLARGAASTALAPLLEIWTTDRGIIADPDDGSLSFAIYDLTTDAKELVPVQVVAPVTVDFDAHRIKDQTGHFAAVGAPLIPADEDEGPHEIRWAWEVDGLPFSYVQRFDVLAGVPRGLGWGYSLVSDFREEDICEDAASTLRLLKLIKAKSEFIEQVTQKPFEPRWLDVKVDGTGTTTLLLGLAPIIALAGVSVRDEPVAIDFESDELRIYNRHLAGLLDPDDRASPRVEIPNIQIMFDGFGQSYGAFGSTVGQPMIRSGFPRSSQNVTVRGLFGYTDPDGTHLGKTPDAIREVTMLLVNRGLPKLGDAEAVWQAQEGHRVKSIKTRDQSLEFQDERAEGVVTITGDAAIDRILSRYIPGLRLGST